MDVAAQRGNKGNAKQDWLDVNDKMGLFQTWFPTGKLTPQRFFPPSAVVVVYFSPDWAGWKSRMGPKERRRRVYGTHCSWLTRARGTACSGKGPRRTLHLLNSETGNDEPITNEDKVNKVNKYLVGRGSGRGRLCSAGRGCKHLRSGTDCTRTSWTAYGKSIRRQRQITFVHKQPLSLLDKLLLAKMANN